MRLGNLLSAKESLFSVRIMDINLLPLFSDTDSEDEEEIAEKDAARAFEKGAKKIAGKCTAYGYSKEKAEKSAKVRFLIL